METLRSTEAQTLTTEDLTIFLGATGVYEATKGESPCWDPESTQAIQQLSHTHTIDNNPVQ